MELKNQAQTKTQANPSSLMSGASPRLRHYTRESLPHLLRSHGVNPTHQRMEIAHVLFSRCEHLSADQVLAIVNERQAETSKATVYNTLNLFLEKKLIREVIVDPNRVFYDPNTEPHHHFYNVDSGELSDINSGDIQISSMPNLPEGMITDGIDVIVRIRSAARRINSE